MGLITPLALVLATLALPIVALYMLRPRRPIAPVSSILLWERALADMEASAPWQRPRLNWLLLLQLLILLLLVAALARPFSTSAEPATGNLVVILDASASMGARDGAGTRFNAARAEVRALIDRLGAEERMALILAGPVAEALQPPTSDRAALRGALDRARPSLGLASMTDAVALATATAQRLPGGQVVILSDGGFPPLDPTAVTLPTRVVTVGAPAPNLGITAMAARRTATGDLVFVRVVNTGPEARRDVLSLLAGDRLLDARALDLAPGETASVTFEAPDGEAVLRAEIRPGDALAADDVAWLAPEAAGARVLLVTVAPGNFLARGLALLPGVSLYHAENADAEGYDWHVFDNLAPARLSGPSLLVNPPAVNDVIPVTGEIERPRVSRMASDHPLLRSVDLSRLNIARAARLEPPAWAETLVEADGLPLLLAGEYEGRRVAILAFDLQHSDLPLQVAFPVLLSNLQRWLTGGALGGLEGALRPGDSITLNLPAGIDAVVVSHPDGREATMPVAGGIARLTETTLPGPYRFSLRAAGQERQALWATVNLLSEAESDLTPVTHPSLGATPVPVDMTAESVPSEWWRPLLLIGGLLLLAEWWIFYRGLPSRLAWRQGPA